MGSVIWSIDVLTGGYSIALSDDESILFASYWDTANNNLTHLAKIESSSGNVLSSYSLPSSNGIKFLYSNLNRLLIIHLDGMYTLLNSSTFSLLSSGVFGS